MNRFLSAKMLNTLTFMPKYCFEFPKQHSETHGSKVPIYSYRF